MYIYILWNLSCQVVPNYQLPSRANCQWNISKVVVLFKVFFYFKVFFHISKIWSELMCIYIPPVTGDGVMWRKSRSRWPRCQNFRTRHGQLNRETVVHWLRVVVYYPNPSLWLRLVVYAVCFPGKLCAKRLDWWKLAAQIRPMLFEVVTNASQSDHLLDQGLRTQQVKNPERLVFEWPTDTYQYRQNQPNLKSPQIQTTCRQLG